MNPSMSSVAVTQRSPVRSPPFEHQQPFFLLRWLDSAWFPWAWMALWAGAQVGHALVSWHFFATGAALLSSDATGAGLHMYATHPQLQIGPLAFLAATPLNGLASWLSGAITAASIAATAPAMLQSLSRLPGLTISNRQRGLAAGVLMPVWAELAVHYAHLDDALALVLLVGAIHAVARSRPLAAALLLAASAGAKPWALAFVPLLLVLPRVRWRRAAAVWSAAVVAAWLPFVVADPRTLHAGGFSIPNVASSSLRALGITAASTPSWDRPVQLLVGVVLGAVAVRRGRWLVVPAVVLAVRMLLDPGAYPYYTADLLLATVAVDVGWRQTRWPWVSMGVVAGLYAVRFMGLMTPTDAELGWLRAATLLAVLTVEPGPDWRKHPSYVLPERLRARRVRALIVRLGFIHTPSARPAVSATGQPDALASDPQSPDLAILMGRPS